jgi:periplasmic copper chaperone A
MTGSIAHGGRARLPARGAITAAMLLAAGAALADPHQIRHGDIVISNRTVRASLAGSPNSAAYMVIANSGAAPDSLVAARCACADSVGIHKTEDMRGMTTMTSAAPVVIPAHGQVTFRPGGLHLMLTRLREPLADGGQQDITLVFQRAGTVRANFHIRAQIPGGAPPPMAGMGR